MLGLVSLDDVGSFGPSPRMSMANASGMMKRGPNTNTASSMYSKQPPRGPSASPKKKKKKKKTAMQKAAKKTKKLLGFGAKK